MVQFFMCPLTLPFAHTCPRPGEMPWRELEPRGSPSPPPFPHTQVTNCSPLLLICAPESLLASSQTKTLQTPRSVPST